ncbi:hypothetical protein [Streptomyces sp. NPDC017448]|uniref:hypothetical protein n=1 Tax=Streptomyces sp. NPDC017448 TaxID=3364996 RepID=UPI0037A10983
MTKALGVPGPDEHGGHMVKRLTTKPQWTFECQDCHMRGDAGVFSVGVRGCAKRPESLDYLSISMFDGLDNMTTQDRAVAAREHWKGFADRIGMKIQGWTPVDSDPEVCARFTFWPHDGSHEANETGGNYELRFGQKGSHPHEVHAVRV